MGLCTVCVDASDMSAAGRDGCVCDSGSLVDGACTSDSDSSDSSSDGTGASFLKVAIVALFCLLALLL